MIIVDYHCKGESPSFANINQTNIHQFKINIMLSNKHHTHHHCSIITSVLKEPPPSRPPLIRILPPTIDARAPSNARGREARVVQADAPWRRVTTEEVQCDVNPPATTKACRGSKDWLVWSRVQSVPVTRIELRFFLHFSNSIQNQGGTNCGQLVCG